MICLNNANNPTGTVLDTTFLKQVVEIAKSVDAYVLVDEVYLPLDNPDSFTSIVDLYDKGIATNSLSKPIRFPELESVGLILTQKSLTYSESIVTTL
ncbi:aspartate aminotransferase [Lentilactobacillus kosonis]|uniref:Aspartate aminotransferase n=1 Tax=Lentilactobacillus kosonis TaxID=2810561 RepID=A0A401FJ45_9LACO|nr:aspartate aminotransferase [Lentilactobacillus kosonis]